jgi:hypothetical protein
VTMRGYEGRGREGERKEQEKSFFASFSHVRDIAGKEGKRYTPSEACRRLHNRDRHNRHITI